MRITSMKAPIVTECEGCGKILTGSERGAQACSVYEFPSSKWRFGRKCPVATHLHAKQVDTKFVNPLKASRRKAKGK